MKNFEEAFYKILVTKESFYMKQYYSEIQKKDTFIAIKELRDGIYCVLISNEGIVNEEYLEVIEYIKTLGKPFSLNIVILSAGEQIYINNMPMANRLIINKESLSVIQCEELCIPLKQVLEGFIERNKTKVDYNNKKFFEYKIPTLILIGINVIIFIITQIAIYNIKKTLSSSQVLSDELINIITNSVLISFGAKYNALINSGQIWRLFTCAFLHSNIIHIGFNMYSLYIIGPQIDQVYGTKKYLFIYFSSCITASLLSYLMSPNSISVGASGGIFGLMGALLAFSIIERHRINKKNISSLIQIIIINLFIGLSVNNIDNFAHVGGLIGGISIGYISYKFSKQVKNT